MSFPEYVKKIELVGEFMKISSQPPLRTPKGLFEIYADLYQKPKQPDAIVNEEGFVLKKHVVFLGTLQDVSWIYHKRITKYFTAIIDPANPAWCNLADIS